MKMYMVISLTSLWMDSSHLEPEPEQSENQELLRIQGMWGRLLQELQCLSAYYGGHLRSANE